MCKIKKAIIAGLSLLLCVSVAHAFVFVDSFETSTCDAESHFALGIQPSFEIHVATDGNNDTGTGSKEMPYASLSRALQDAAPGASIIIHEGNYSGGIFASNIRGTAQAHGSRADLVGP